PPDAAAHILLSLIFSLFIHRARRRRDLHTFPTRRSSDLGGSVGVDLRTPHGRRIFAYGFCEPAARAMRALLSPGEVMIDAGANIDRKSTRLNSSHRTISYAVFCLKKKMYSSNK